MEPVDFDRNVVLTLYRAQVGDEGHPRFGESVTYGRDYWSLIDGFWQREAHRLRFIGPRDTVLVVGAGFGYLQEAMPHRNVWGIEPGSWYWDHPDEFADVPIARDWLGSPTAAASLAALGAPPKFDWVVDEDAVTVQVDDLAATEFITACEEVAKRQVVHVVTPRLEDQRESPFVLWRSMDEWRRYAPHHRWEDRRG